MKRRVDHLPPSHVPLVSAEELRIPGTDRMFCTRCAKARPQSDFEVGAIECRDCAILRVQAEADSVLQHDRRTDVAWSLLSLLALGEVPQPLNEAQKRQLRNLIIDACALDRELLKVISGDLAAMNERLKWHSQNQLADEIAVLKRRP